MAFVIRDFKTISKNIIGFMFLNIDNKMLRIIKSNYDNMYKRYTIAYELGHFILHYNVCKNKDNPFILNRNNINDYEQEAYMFANELLINTEIFINKYNELKDNYKNLSIIRKLSDIFQVPQYFVNEKIKEINLFKDLLI